MRLGLARLSIATVLIGFPIGGYAAPAAAPQPGVVAHPPIVLAQGWWEHEHQYGRARQRYWRLPPDAVERYNQLQADLNELRAQRHEIDERIARKTAEQHRILGFSGY